MSSHSSHGSVTGLSSDQPSRGSAADTSIAGAVPDAFAGLDHLAATAATAPASSILPPLDLTQLGDFHSTNASQGTLVVSGPMLVGGNVAFVDAGTLASGGYVVSAGTDQGLTSANGGATVAIDSGIYGSPVGDTRALVFDFHLDSLNPGQYNFSLHFLTTSSQGSGKVVTAERQFQPFGDVSVLGWNSDSILLSTTYSNTYGPTGDIVISTEDMSKQKGLPTNTTFTTTGPAPVVLGVTVTEVPCFAAGTRIATPDGQCAVEELAAGDAVLTHDGRRQRISWVGSRVVNCSAHPAPEKVLPVRVRRHAFGANLPQRDLVLSPDHAVFLGGVLIPICELMNGQNVIQERVHTVRYVHVELPLHDILLAEGLPCESFLDIGNHTQFGEGPGATPLHADFAPTALAWEAACAPLVLAGPEVEAARVHLSQAALLAA